MGLTGRPRPIVAMRVGQRLAALLAWVAMLGARAPCGAAARLELAADTGSDLQLWVTNAGDETAAEVIPELLFQHRSETAQAARLAPGARHEWRFPLAAVPAPGTFAATIRVRWADEHGRRRSMPLVALVSTRDAPPSAVRARLDPTSPVTRIGGARLVLENPGSRAVAGRVVFVLPRGLDTEPESMPAQLPAGGRTEIPVVLENTGALPPAAYPAYAVFEYPDDGGHATVLAQATIDIAREAAGSRARPLLVGLGALGITFVLLAVAWRAAARR